MKAQLVYQKLNETYESSVELKRVVDLLMKNRKKLDKPHKLKSLFKNQIKNFPILGKFLESEVGIVFQPDMPYPMFSFPPYNMEEEIETNKKRFPYLTDEKYPWGIVIINNQENALLHELQHAYDYFRSNRKMANDKKFTKFLKYGGFKEEETQLKRYMRLKPEQSAYFTEVFAWTQKYEIQHNEKLSTRDAFEIFKNIFPEWRILPPKDKKIFARKFSQHWEKHKEESK